MTAEERVRALIGNLKNWNWDICQQFRIEKEDADALREYLRDDKKVSAYAERRTSD